MKLIYSIILVILANYSFSENYVCSYNLNNEDNMIEIKREGLAFNHGEIFYEDNSFIYLTEVSTNNIFDGIKSTIIDKELNKFRMMVMYEPGFESEGSAIITGNCIVIQ